MINVNLLIESKPDTNSNNSIAVKGLEPSPINQ